MLYMVHLKHVSVGLNEAIERCCASRSKHERHPVPEGILVLCPNAALSSQVRTMLPAMQITVSCIQMPLLASTHRRLPRVKHDRAHARSKRSQSATRFLPDASSHFLQVLEVAESLKDREGRPLVRSSRIASSLPLPHDIPDIVIATPAGLMNATVELGPFAGWEWTKAGIVSRCVML